VAVTDRQGNKLGQEKADLNSKHSRSGAETIKGVAGP
jgi:hypothetical protein